MFYKYALTKKLIKIKRKIIRIYFTSIKHTLINRYINKKRFLIN